MPELWACRVDPRKGARHSGSFPRKYCRSGGLHHHRSRHRFSPDRSLSSEPLCPLSFFAMPVFVAGLVFDRGSDESAGTGTIPHSQLRIFALPIDRGGSYARCFCDLAGAGDQSLAGRSLQITSGGRLGGAAVGRYPRLNSIAVPNARLLRGALSGILPNRLRRSQSTGAIKFKTAVSGKNEEDIYGILQSMRNTNPRRRNRVRRLQRADGCHRRPSRWLNRQCGGDARLHHHHSRDYFSGDGALQQKPLYPLSSLSVPVSRGGGVHRACSPVDVRDHTFHGFPHVAAASAGLGGLAPSLYFFVAVGKSRTDVKATRNRRHGREAGECLGSLVPPFTASRNRSARTNSTGVLASELDFHPISCQSY